MMEIYFSVIIPAFNEASQIGQCIESVMANQGEGIEFEIIIVDHNSTDGTPEIARELNAEVIENSEGEWKSIASLRNAGAKAAHGRVFAFLDADMVVPDNWLISAKEYFNKGFQGAIGFVDRAPSTAGWVGRTWADRLYLKHDKLTNVDYLAGRNVFINRHVFETVNGFNGMLQTNEDKDFILRVLDAGFQAVLVPGLNVMHLGYERNMMEFLRKEFWRQGNTIEYAKSRGFSLRTLRNPALSLWHISFVPLITLTLLLYNFSTSLYLMILWMLPSLMITFSERAYRKGPAFFLLLFLLTFLRWHVSGFALITQIAKGISCKRVNAY